MKWARALQACVLVGCAQLFAATPLGTVFTYQGQLKENGQPVSDTVDLEFTLGDSAVLGIAVAPPITLLNVEIVNGLFTVELDFGDAIFTGDERWLQVEVRRPAGVGGYQVLTPRQRLDAAPYAQGLHLPMLSVAEGSANLFTVRNTGDSGSAGVFETTDASNSSSALRASTTGLGTAVSGASATGRGGSFSSGGTVAAVQATNSSTGPGLRAVNESTGPAVYADGDLVFNDDEDGIVFNLTIAPNVPMITMFPLGTANANRMVLAHSPGNPDFGLEYADVGDQFRFLGNGADVVAVNLLRPDASPGGGGYLVIGSPASTNIAVDDNEIMARNNGAVATLALNVAGGDVTVFQSGPGELGIGTSNPNAPLHVVGSSGDTLYATNTGTGRVAQFFVGDADTANGIYAVTYGGGYAGSFEAHEPNATAALNAYKNGGLALRVWSTLSVAGTPATDAAMAVVGGSDTAASGGGFAVFGSIAGANVSVDNNEIMARNNGATATLALNAEGGNIAMIQTGSGGVSIGTTVVPAGVLLAVDGKVLCEEMEVQLSGDWPDFVFADDYALMPLDELERAVDEHKHLPGIPSAAVVAKEGINVGEMQAQLLKKVEELTLYVIDVNKQVEAVRTENEQLRARIAQLEGGR